MTLARSWPLVWSLGVGLQWPTLPHTAPLSSLRASSPSLDQGGIVKTLMQASFSSKERTVIVLTPQSGFDRRRLAVANPTTPASAAGDFRLSDSPPSVPSLCSADAAGSQVPLAPTRSSPSRVWSAYADDGERSAFPLEPPSFALFGWRPRYRGAFASLENLAVALPLFRVSQAFSRAGGCM